MNDTDLPPSAQSSVSARSPMPGVPGPGTRLRPFGIGVLAVEPIVERVDRRVRRRRRPESQSSEGPGHPSGDDREDDRPESRWGVVEAGRLEVAMAAYVLGYFLLDTIEVGDGEGPAGPGWSRVRRLAAAAEADALLVHGPVNPAVVDPFAAEFRLMVRVVRDVIARPGFGPSSGWLGAWGAAPQPPMGRTGR